MPTVRTSRLVQLAATTIVATVTVASLPAQAPAFEVASIRPAPTPGVFRFSFLPGGQLVITGVPAAILVQRAFRTPATEIVGLPEWTQNERFNIQAKAPDGAPSATSDVLAMLRTLLADRFQLRTHRETREIPAYLLEREDPSDPPGYRLERSSLDCTGMIPGTTGTADRDCTGRMELGATPSDPWTMRFKGRSMDMLARDLQQYVGRPVKNQTGLEEHWDVSLTFTPEQGPGANTTGVSIYTAVREQLALKLTSTRAAVDVLVVDTISRPSPN